MKLTHKDIRRLESRAGVYEVMDDGNPGLGIRVHPSGLKSWIYRYRFEGRLRRMTLGAWRKEAGAGMSRDDAVTAYMAKRQQHRGKTDPLEAAREERRYCERAESERQQAAASQRAKDAFTVTSLVEFYGRHHEKRSLSEDLRMLHKDVLPLIGERPAQDISPDDVQNLIDAIVERGSPRSAALTLAALRKAFSVARKRRKVPRNPCADIDAPKQGERDRNLNKTELRKFFARLPAVPSADVRDVLEIVLLTASRKGEACAVEWTEVDFDEGVWTMPRAKTKNKREHRVVLSRQAIAVFRRRWEDRREQVSFVFPARAGTMVPHLRGDAVNEAVSKAQETFGLKHWTPHDLRRTAVTHLSRMGCPRLLQNRITNHYERSVAALYDRHEFDDEAREWLQKLADFLDTLKGDSVIPLRRKGR